MILFSSKNVSYFFKKIFFSSIILFFVSVAFSQNKESNGWAHWSELEPGLKFVLGQDICFPLPDKIICQNQGKAIFIESLDGGFGVPLMILNAKSSECSEPHFISEAILVLPQAASPGRDRRVIVQYGPDCLWTIWVEVYDFYDFSFMRWPSYAEIPTYFAKAKSKIRTR